VEGYVTSPTRSPAVADDFVQAFAILPIFSPFTSPSPAGFPTKLPDLLPLARGHTAPVLDTAWSPFDDNLVASAGEDGKSASLLPLL